jgi:hypothetical protein
MTLDLTENASENARRAEMVNAVANGYLPPPPPVIPAEHVPQPEIHAARWAPASFAMTPWQARVFPMEKRVDMAAARDELRLAIIDRATAAADLAAVADELAGAERLVEAIEAGQAEHAEQGNRQIVNLADRLRDWLTAGSPGERPCGSVPPAPAPRDEAELAAARLARGDVASDHDRARAVHAAAVAAVDSARRMVLTAHAQELAARYEATLAELAELQADGRALLGLTVAGTPALAGFVRERLPASLAPAGGDDAAARWAEYARLLDGDADARLDL